MSHKVLLVEDTEEYRIVVQETIGPHHELVMAGTVAEAIAALATHEFSLVLLDLTLPDKDGYAFLTKLQSDPRTAEIPVICLTSRGETADKVAAFSLGVDDYVVKPFDTIELRARVESKLSKRDRSSKKSDVIVIEQLRIDREHHKVTFTDGKKEHDLALTPTEFRLLCHLAKSPDRVFTREQLMQAGWASDSEVFERAVDVHICGLRKKMGPLGDWVQAVPGVGYKLAPSKTAVKKSA